MVDLLAWSASQFSLYLPAQALPLSATGGGSVRTLSHSNESRRLAFWLGRRTCLRQRCPPDDGTLTQGSLIIDIHGLHGNPDERFYFTLACGESANLRRGLTLMSATAATTAMAISGSM